MRNINNQSTNKDLLTKKINDAHSGKEKYYIVQELNCTVAVKMGLLWAGERVIGWWKERYGKTENSKKAISEEESGNKRAIMMCARVLLDVILSDKNQEKGTTLHFPALFDELQGILDTQTERHRVTANYQIQARSLFTSD